MKFKPSKTGLSSIFMWLLSFILAFKIQPNSRYIWLPDFLLLLGFCPLLIARQARWLWLLFGICNMVAGFTLVLSSVIPDAYFDSYHMLAIKKHLQLYHPFLVWLLLGFISGLVGGVFLIIDLINLVAKKIKSGSH